MTTRGERNNNPTNIDWHANTTWQGAVGKEPGPSGRFIVFKAPEWGIRAAAKILLTYQNHDGCKTIRQIVSRWAPPGENNTGAYVAAVVAGCGLKPEQADDPINVDSVAIMLPLVKAVILHENGQNPYADSVVLDGIHRAGIADAPAKPLVASNTFKAQAGAAVATVAAGATTVAQYAGPVKDAADKLSDYTGSPIIQHAVTVLLTVAGGLTLLGVASAWLQHRKA